VSLKNWFDWSMTSFTFRLVTAASLMAIAVATLPGQTAPANHTPFYTPSLFMSGQGVQGVPGLAVSNTDYIDLLTAYGGGSYLQLSEFPPKTGPGNPLGSAGGLNLPAAPNAWMAADGQGALYIADGGTDIVYKLTNGVTLVPLVGSTDTSGAPIFPVGLAVDPAGQNIYINDAFQKIRWVHSNGSFSNLATGSDMGSIAVDSAGYLYAFVNQQVVRFLPGAPPGAADYWVMAGGGSTVGDGPSSSATFSSGSALAVNASLNANDHGIYVADFGNSRIYRIDYAGLDTAGYVTTIYQGPLSGNARIAVDGAGRVFFVAADESVWQLNPSQPINTVVASLPADFNDGMLTAESFLDVRVASSTPSNPEIQTLPFVGNASTINGTITNTGTEFASPAGYPWALLDTARDVVLLHPEAGSSVEPRAADFAYCPTVSGSYQFQGTFARANSDINAGLGVTAMVFEDSSITSPLFSANIPAGGAVDPTNYFGEPNAAAFETNLSLNRGDCVRFAVFASPSDNSFDATALTFTATSTPAPNARVTVDTSPTGLQITVDGTVYTAPALFVNWVAGGSHTIAATSQAGAGAQYDFQTWSDGGAASHVIWVPSPPPAPYTITADFVGLCEYSLNPASLQSPVPVEGGLLSVAIGTAAGCAWTVSGDTGPALPDWITLNGSSSGSGPATVQFQVGRNLLSSTRSATISIAGVSFSMTQAGTGMGVANGASFAQSFSPGMLMSVFGTGLSTGGPQTVVAAPLPVTSDSGTTVTINGIPAPLLYISATQINLQIPYEVPVGAADLSVSSGGQQIGIVSFPVQATAPGIFADAANGHIVPHESAQAGSIIDFYLTGVGAVTPSEATGNVPPAGTAPIPFQAVTMTVGGVPVTPVYMAIPGWSIGVLQINFTVPSNVSGTQPVVVTVGGVPSPAALLTITP